MEKMTKSTKIMIWIVVILGVIAFGVSIIGLFNNNSNGNTSNFTTIEQPF
jgi:flagellar basal body-associated protein FliL